MVKKDLVMIRILPIWLFISFFFGGSACLGQEALKILTPALELRDAKGIRINAKALAGDVGRNVSGGSNKRIIWDLGADKLY